MVTKGYAKKREHQKQLLSASIPTHSIKSMRKWAAFYIISNPYLKIVWECILQHLIRLLLIFLIIFDSLSSKWSPKIHKKDSFGTSSDLFQQKNNVNLKKSIWTWFLLLFTINANCVWEYIPFTLLLVSKTLIPFIQFWISILLSFHESMTSPLTLKLFPPKGSIDLSQDPFFQRYPWRDSSTCSRYHLFFFYSPRLGDWETTSFFIDKLEFRDETSKKGHIQYIKYTKSVRAKEKEHNKKFWQLTFHQNECMLKYFLVLFLS